VPHVEREVGDVEFVCPVAGNAEVGATRLDAYTGGLDTEFRDEHAIGEAPARNQNDSVPPVVIRSAAASGMTRAPLLLANDNAETSLAP
jgi:hypothetical protein